MYIIYGGSKETQLERIRKDNPESSLERRPFSVYYAEKTAYFRGKSGGTSLVGSGIS